MVTQNVPQGTTDRQHSLAEIEAGLNAMTLEERKQILALILILTADVPGMDITINGPGTLTPRESCLISWYRYLPDSLKEGAERALMAYYEGKPMKLEQDANNA